MHVKTFHTKAICVLGMHRSGTSTISRAMNLLGAYLGEEKDLYGPAPDNPEGYWERKELVDFHDRLLEKLKRRWDTMVPLPDGWFLEEEFRPDRDELTGIIRNAFSQHELWGWKDPRTCILLPLWKHILGEMGIALSVVFIVRHPIDVANSLMKRDGFTLGKSFGIWFNYNLTALYSVPDVPIVFVSYDRFLEDSEKELRKCAAGLSIDWPEDDSELKNSLRTFVRPDLRHSLTNAGAIQDSPVPVQVLFSLLTKALDNPLSVTSEFFEQVEQLYTEFFSYAGFYHSELERLWERDKELSELCRLQDNNQRLLIGANKQIDELNRQIDEQCAQLATGEQHLEELRERLVARERNIHERDKWLEERDQQLEQYQQWLTARENDVRDRDRWLTEKESVNKALLNSYSWKITAPFRWILSFIMQAQGK
jgi:hypothetical protein